MILSSTSVKEPRIFSPNLVDRSQLKSSELESSEKIELKSTILEAIKNIVRFRKSKKILS